MYDDSEFIPEVSEEKETAYAKMAKARSTHESTNGRVFKPFKSQYGASELFSNNELVSIAQIGLEDGTIAYSATGVSFNAKAQTFDMKSAVFFSLEELERYIRITGEVVEYAPTKPKTYMTVFAAKTDFTSLDSVTIPKDTVITKTTEIMGSAILTDIIIAKGYESAVISNEKLSLFCRIVEPRVELIRNEDDSDKN